MLLGINLQQILVACVVAPFFWFAYKFFSYVGFCLRHQGSCVVVGPEGVFCKRRKRHFPWTKVKIQSVHTVRSSVLGHTYLYIRLTEPEEGTSRRYFEWRLDATDVSGSEVKLWANTWHKRAKAHAST
jgi:hypothetical protein